MANTTTPTPEAKPRERLATLQQARKIGDPAAIQAAIRASAEAANANLAGQAHAALARALADLDPDTADDAVILEAETRAWHELPHAVRQAMLAGEGTAKESPEPLTGEDLPNTDPPARQWLIQDLIPAGRLSALYGTGGGGKSMLALQVAAAVMHGGSPLGVKDATDAAAASLRSSHPLLQPLPELAQGKVLWLTWEDESDEIRRRWRMAHHAGAIREGFPVRDRLTLVDMRKVGGPLWAPAGSGHVSNRADWTDAGRRFLRTLEGHRLAIIDPLAAAFASSELDRALVRAFTSAIDGEAERAGCAVLLIAHPSQSGAKADGSGYSGSTDWQASVRAHLILEASDATGHTVPGTDRNGKDNGVNAKAWRLNNPKQSYAPDGGHLWLIRHWQAPDPERNSPAQLAWFGAPAKAAAKAFEQTESRRAGRTARTVTAKQNEAGAGNHHAAGNGNPDVAYV